MRIQCIVGTSLRILKGFGKETMRRKENKKKSCGRRGARWAALLLLVVVMAVSSGCTGKEELVFSQQNEQPDTEAAEEAAEEETVSEPRAQAEPEAESDDQLKICVHVCGAVKNPGVYELPAGSRVYEAVQAAGGFSENADESYVNQAQQLPDAVQLVIPTVDQVEALEQGELPQTDFTGSLEAESAADDGKININTASESQLCDIPGIGAVRASAIAAYRQEHGAFETIEDIMKVSGIKQGTYDKIKDSITVN